MKKYEMLYDEKTKLYRIKALIDIPVYGVKVGDIGGFIAKESNLSHRCNCWIFNDAKVYEDGKIYDDVTIRDNAEVFGKTVIFKNASISGNVKIYGNAVVSDYAKICNRAKVYGNSNVFGHVTIYEDAEIYGNAKAYNNCYIYGKAKVYDDAKAFGNSSISGVAELFNNAIMYIGSIFHGKHATNVKYFYLGKHMIVIDGDHLNIGCHSFTIDKWIENGVELGEKAGYTEKETLLYMNFIRYIKDNLMN